MEAAGISSVHTQTSKFEYSEEWHNNSCKSPYIQNSMCADMLMMSNIFSVEAGSHLF